MSDEENAVFSGVLYDLAPLLIREQAKLKGYAYELVLECFKHVLQIQAGTKDISLRLERMERLLEEESLQPELPVQTFYRLWGQSVKAEFGNPESRLEKHRDLLSFLDDRLTKEMFDELCLDLPETSGGAGPSLAQFMCVGNSSRRPLFYAQTLVWFAKAWTERYGAERPDADRSCKKLSRTVESRQIEKHLNQAEASIKTARADSWIFLHMISEAAIQRVRQKNAITIR